MVIANIVFSSITNHILKIKKKNYKKLKSSAPARAYNTKYYSTCFLELTEAGQLGPSFRAPDPTIQSLVN